MINEINTEKLFAFYKDQLENNFLKFWDKAIDREYGGIYTCYNNYGDKLISKDKYIWSQGRFVWLWAKVLSLIENGIIIGDRNKYQTELEMGFNFIKDNSFLGNGNCAYLTDRQGNIKIADTSIYVDCFVLLGFAAYIGTTGEIQYIDKMMRHYEKTFSRIESGNYKTDPYPIPAKYMPHGVNMMMLHVTTEIYKALNEFHDARIELLTERIKNYISIITETLCDNEYRIIEMLPSESEDTVFSRHFTPGHVLESMWFIMDAYNELEITNGYDKILNIIKKTYKLGWDKEYGGILRHVDKEGGKPKGEQIGEQYEKLILDTWDTKLWWPHSEALYTTLLMAKTTGDIEMEELYIKTHNYVFQTFPNHDLGEWIQIRDRMGKPVEKVVALPVKDPYHIIRNFMLNLELLNS